MQTLKITWRDEAYGRLAGASAAFRVYGEEDGSPILETREVRAILAARGFTWNGERAAWVSYRPGAAESLTADLEAAGVTVSHAGAWQPTEPAARPWSEMSADEKAREDGFPNAGGA